MIEQTYSESSTILARIVSGITSSKDQIVF
jgi:hypothetical protein